MRLRGAVLLVVALPSSAAVEALPAFARRYEAACDLCHAGYPKLTFYGERFKEDGFRTPDEPTFDSSEWLRSVPVVARAAVTRTFVERGDAATTLVVRGISAGNLGPRLAYWLDDGFSVAASKVAHLRPDNAWARVELTSGGGLYVKGGRFELDLPFSQARSPHLFAYEAYLANAGIESDSVAGYKEGLEVGGPLLGRARWSLALVRRRNTEQDGLLDLNAYLRGSRRLGRGRVGLFAYVGSNRLPVGTSPEASTQDDLLRVGVDGRTWIGDLDLYGVYLHGRNSDPGLDGKPRSLDAAFVQADWHARRWLALTLRFNLSSLPAATGGRTSFLSLFPGVWVWPWQGHVKLSFEYGVQDQDRRDFGAVQLEAAF